MARAAAARVLHIHGSFGEDKPLAQRCVRVMNALGSRLKHSVVADDGDFSAAAGATKSISPRALNTFPGLSGLPLPGRMQTIARALQDFDLVLTYGRGGVVAALAHTMFSKVHALPPLIHHEDGSDEGKGRRNGLGGKWYRRIGLGKAAGLVVPTEAMERVALIDWQQPIGRVKTIRDGVDLDRFTAVAKPDALPRLLRRPGELWIGCFTREIKNLAALTRTLGRLPPEWHLVIVGAAGEEAFQHAGSEQHRIHTVAHVKDRAAALALFDIVADASAIDTLPIEAIEAVAAGKPVVCFGSMTAAEALADDNAALLASEPPDQALVRLAGDPYLRRSLGGANRQRAESERAEAAMIASYRRLYSSAIGGDGL